MPKPEPTKEDLRRTRDETVEHILAVQGTLGAVSNQIRCRGKNHDRSKLTTEELPHFAVAENLKKLKYGSREYTKALAGLKPALTHHYKANRHHPEHFMDGIVDMNLVDIIEMVCDWHCAAMRHGEDHNIFKSINHNRMRFHIHHQLACILWNTAIDVLGEEPAEGYEMTMIAVCTTCDEWQDPHNKKCQKCGEYNLREV
jgi:ribosomal protein L40E